MTVYTYGHSFGKEVGKSADGRLTIIQVQPYDTPNAYAVARTSSLRELNKDAVADMLEDEIVALLRRYEFLELPFETISQSTMLAISKVYFESDRRASE